MTNNNINLNTMWENRINDDKHYNLQQMSKKEIWTWRLNAVSMYYCNFISRGEYYNVENKKLYYYLIPKELRIILKKFNLYLEKVCISKKLYYEYFIKQCPNEMLQLINKIEIKDYLKNNFNQNGYIYYINKNGKREMCMEINYSEPEKSDCQILEERLINIKSRKIVVLFQQKIRKRRYIEGIQFVFKHNNNNINARAISMKTRVAVFRRDKYTCRYCGWKNGTANTSDKVLTIDHKVPVAFGGTNKKENLITCCLTCNLKKHDNILPENIRIFQTGTKNAKERI